MSPPATGQLSLPPLYRAGGETGWVEPELRELRDRLGACVGLGVDMPSPSAPGTVNVWPITRFGSWSAFASTIVAASTPYLAASESRVSDEPTVITTPSTGGIVRVCPMWRSSLAVRLLAHQIVIIETPNLWAIPVRVSPLRTR